MIFVALFGYSGVGKDEACKALGWPRCAFADAIKADVDPLFQPGTPKEVKRETYVAYGKARRVIDPKHWIKQLVVPNSPRVCLTDGRYINELEFVLDRDGIPIWIHREGVGPANREESESFSIISACNLWINHVINDGTPDELAESIKQIAYSSKTEAPSV